MEDAPNPVQLTDKAEEIQTFIELEKKDIWYEDILKESKKKLKLNARIQKIIAMKNIIIN